MKSQNHRSTIFVDFFDSIVIRSVDPIEVFAKKSWIFAVYRSFVELILSRFRKSQLNIEEISRFIPYWNVTKEIQLECEFLELNSDLIKFLIEQENLGVDIHIVSDTYFSKEQVLNILGTFTNWRPKDVFTSSEHGTSKSQGLYKYVGDLVQSEMHSTLVIGDDVISDGIHSIKFGYDFKLLIPSFISNLNGDEFVSQTYLNLIENFTTWVYENAKSKKVDKLLFLGRDSYLVYLAFLKKKIADIEFEYVPASRRIALQSREVEFKNYAGYRGNRLEPNWANSSKTDFTSFYSEKIGNSDKIGIVDLGWNASFQKALEKVFKNKQFEGLYLGILEHNPHRENVNGFLFSPGSKPLRKMTKFKPSIDLLEILLSEPTPSSIYVTETSAVKEILKVEDKVFFKFVEIYQEFLLDAISDKIEELHNDKQILVNQIINLSANPPKWFVNIARVVVRDVSVNSEWPQHLFLSRTNQLKNLDRIWWMHGQVSYVNLMLKRNPVYALILMIFAFIVQIRFCFRLIFNFKDLNSLLVRFMNRIKQRFAYWRTDVFTK